MAGFNNPLMAGLIDLLANGVPARDILVLSIGTGTVKLVPATAAVSAPPDLAAPLTPPGQISDLEKASNCINDDPPDDASYSAHIILASSRGAITKEAGPVVRLSPIVRPVLQNRTWKIPTGVTRDQFLRLKDIPMDAVNQTEVDLITVLGDAWLKDGVKNQPIRMVSNDLSCAIGDDVYSAGKRRWTKLCLLNENSQSNGIA